MALTRRQKQIYDFVRQFIDANGYSPSLEEIGRHFGLSSVATVHKHVTNLVRKGLLRRSWNQNRSIEVVQPDHAPRAVEIPLMGRIAAGRPVEAGEARDALAVPSWLVGHGRTYALQVEGDSMADEQIRDGDYVIIEERRSAEPGQIVVAMVHGDDVTLKKFYPDGERVRLQPANRRFEPLLVPTERVEIRGVVRGVVRRC
ncbi:MAG: transcriptional repressor LexA [Acidobacteriota bacterium]|nr:MAG: transcriptional repressor LexA [Acidobacteriota bacterium]